MKKTLLFTLILLPFFGLSQLETVFQNKIDSIYEKNKDAVGIIVHVEAPKQNISWSYAKGVSDIKTNEILKSENPLLLASVTKTYVAAATLRLIENGEISLDQPIKKLLTNRTRKLFENDGYNLDSISVKHLLSQTGGIQDYVNDSYFEFVKNNPTYQWTRNEQIKRAVEVGTPQKIGKKFLYADINFLLLTEIIEKKMKKPFYLAMRNLLKFDELNLDKTWFINLEKYPKNALPLSHQYTSQFKWVSYQVNPSWDLYGGGGLASTAKESALFFQYLFNGKIIQDKQLLEKMHTYVLPPEQSKYCLGLFKFNFGFDAYYHGGWWGTDVVYSPQTDATVSVFVLKNDYQDSINAFLGKEFQKLLLKN